MRLGRRRAPPVLAGVSCTAGDPVEDGAEPGAELIVGEVGRRGRRVLGHGGGQAGEVFGVGQPQEHLGVLRGRIVAADGDYRDAFARYQRRMQDFVERNQQIATGNAKRFTPGNRRQIWLQNQGIRALPYMPGKNWILSLATKGVKEAANAITLPSPAQY